MTRQFRQAVAAEMRSEKFCNGNTVSLDYVYVEQTEDFYDNSQCDSVVMEIDD
ncbi:unnamed protein product, partial [Amoebophrya sp. A120]|eukprot:GSA120T00000451001.1